MKPESQLTFQKLNFQRQHFKFTANLTLTGAKRFVLLAPSGSGKSTLLDLIAGFLTPYSGSILWNQRDLTQEKVSQRPVSYLFQNHNLFEHLSIRRNLALVEKHAKHIESALTQVGLPKAYFPKLPSELSGGEQQRVALARVFLQKRPIILLDEPFSALDPDTKNKICHLVVQLQHQQSALLLAVSHDPLDVERLDATKLTIENGQLTLP